MAILLTKYETASAEPELIINTIIVGRCNIRQGDCHSLCFFLVAFGDGDLSALLEAEGLAEGVAHFRRRNFRTGSHPVCRTPRNTQTSRTILIGNLTDILYLEANFVESFRRDLDSECAIKSGGRQRTNDEA
jgi:hypothetical protein